VTRRGLVGAAMMRRAPLVVTAALLAVACGPGAIVRHGAIDTGVLSSIGRTLEQVRGLRFTAEVPGRLLDDAEVVALLDRELSREFAPGDMERLTAVYQRLGLMPSDTGLQSAFKALYADQLAALYDPRTKTLALTRNGLGQQPMSVRLLGFFTGRDLLGEVLVAHELTHALQDQHYGMPTTMPPITDAQGDRVIARRALIEGDASLASVAYLRPGPLDAATVERFVEQVAAIPEELRARHPNVPEVIRASMAFQYNAGSGFAAAAYLRGGWPAVDAAHRDPPASSEQVLHPEKYFDARDRPIEVALGGTEELERRGWTRVFEDTFGELDVRVLAGRAFDPVRAGAVAAGWGGDRVRALARGDELVIVWLSVWDSEADAVEFADALPALLPDALVERRDSRVLVLLGRETAGLAARVWSRSRLSPRA
jgi:hypothetical protein